MAVSSGQMKDIQTPRAADGRAASFTGLYLNRANRSFSHVGRTDPTRLGDCLRGRLDLSRQRKFDDEYAAVTLDVADRNIAAVSSDGSLSNRESEAETGPIFSAPLTERLEGVTGRFRNAPALILHLNPYAPVFSARSKHDATIHGGVFERVA